MNSSFPILQCTAAHGDGQHWRCQPGLGQPNSSTCLWVRPDLPERQTSHLPTSHSRVWHLHPSQPHPIKPRNLPQCQGPTQNEVTTSQILTVAQQEVGSSLASRVPWSFFTKITNHFHRHSKTEQNRADSSLQHNSFGLKMAGFFPRCDHSLFPLLVAGVPWWLCTESLPLQPPCIWNKSQQRPWRGFAYCPCSSSWHVPERKGWTVICSLTKGGHHQLQTLNKLHLPGKIIARFGLCLFFQSPQ